MVGSRIIAWSLLVGCSDVVYVLDFTPDNILERVRVYSANLNPLAVVVDTGDACVLFYAEDPSVTGLSNCDSLLDSVEACSKNGPVVLVDHIRKRWQQLSEPTIPADGVYRAYYGDPSRPEQSLQLHIAARQGTPYILEVSERDRHARCTWLGDAHDNLELVDSLGSEEMIVPTVTCLDTLQEIATSHKNTALLNIEKVSDA